MIKYSFFLFFFLTSCSFETPTKFSEKALNDSLQNVQNKSISFKEIINQYQGKKIFIDVWASWCADCIKSLPALKKIQKENPSVAFVFISVDENAIAWKKNIQRFKISGNHYNLPKGMKNGDFVDFINLRWIPRYLIVDENGNILLFKATNITDDAILKALKTN
jgi:thiol-disulfide isomerase/thioredoxin